MATKKLPELTPFGEYVEAKYDNDIEKVARELQITRSYIYMLKTGQATPKLGLAFVIDDWAKGKLPVQGWKPWCKEFQK